MAPNLLYRLSLIHLSTEAYSYVVGFVFLQLNISWLNLIVFVSRCNVIYAEVEEPSFQVLYALDVFNESTNHKMSFRETPQSATVSPLF
jgi:hypothetical protein